MNQPLPVGDPVRAFRTALARARKAETRARALQAENTALKAIHDRSTEHQESSR